MPPSTEALTIIKAYDKAREEGQAVSTKIVEGRIAETRKGRREALDLAMELAYDKFQAMQKHLDALSEINLEAARKSSDAASSAYRRPILPLFGVVGCGLLFGILFAWIITKSITAPLPLNQISNGLDTCAQK